MSSSTGISSHQHKCNIDITNIFQINLSQGSCKHATSTNNNCQAHIDIWETAILPPKLPETQNMHVESHREREGKREKDEDIYKSCVMQAVGKCQEETLEMVK